MGGEITGIEGVLNGIMILWLPCIVFFAVGLVFGLKFVIRSIIIALIMGILVHTVLLLLFQISDVLSYIESGFMLIVIGSLLGSGIGTSLQYLIKVSKNNKDKFSSKIINSYH